MIPSPPPPEDHRIRREPTIGDLADFVGKNGASIELSTKGPDGSCMRALVIRVRGLDSSGKERGLEMLVPNVEYEESTYHLANHFAHLLRTFLMNVPTKV